MSYSFDPWVLDALEAPVDRSRSSSSAAEKCKKVIFSKTCNVILIPTRQEYFDASIDLWYTRESFERSKVQASAEIKQVCVESPLMMTKYSLPNI